MCIRDRYSGAGTDPDGTADATATKEGTGGRAMSIQILKQTVEAKSRKLQARWTFESAQDHKHNKGSTLRLRSWRH